MPSGVANSIVSVPVWNEVTVARIHFEDSKYTLYQRKDQVSGGNSRYCELENDIGMTMKEGMTSSSMIIAATIYNHSRSPWVIWVSDAGFFNHLILMFTEKRRV